jgi:hypothetical protein
MWDKYKLGELYAQRKVEVIMEGLSIMHVIVGLNSMAYPCQPKSVSGATPAIFYPIRLKKFLAWMGGQQLQISLSTEIRQFGTTTQPGAIAGLFGTSGAQSAH